MLYKMWVVYGEEPIVVEAEDMDEAFRIARAIDEGYSAAQPMTEEEESRYGRQLY